MPEQRRRFSPQFKAEAVQMVLETGKPIAEVARDQGINEGTLGTWVNLWRRDDPEPVPDSSPVERARGLLQPPTTALDPGLPHPDRSPDRLPDCGDRRRVINPRTCPRSLTQPEQTPSRGAVTASQGVSDVKG
jgi:transposase-like protein